MLSRFYSGDRVSSTSTLASVSSNERIDPALFRIPAGYRENDPEAMAKQALDSAIAMLAMVEAAVAKKP